MHIEELVGSNTCMQDLCQLALSSAATSIIRFSWNPIPFAHICMEYGARSTKYMSQEVWFSLML